MKEVLLKDIRFEDMKDAVHKWSRIDIDGSALYYKDDPNHGNGFYFLAIEVTGYQHDPQKDESFDPETTTVEVLFFGTARFDGTRHLYMGSNQTDNFGYLYYPNLELLTKILFAVSELELKYCQDYITP